MPSSEQSKHDCSKYEKMTLFQLLCEYWELSEYYEDMLYGYEPYYRGLLVISPGLWNF